MTVSQLADALNISLSLAKTYLRMLHKQERVYVIGRRKSAGNKPSRIFKTGDFVDFGHRKRKSKYVDRRKETAIAGVLKLLLIPRTAYEVARLLGLSKTYAQRFIRDLHNAGRIYVKTWQPPVGKGNYTAVYVQGNKPDAVYFPARKRVKCRAKSKVTCAVSAEKCHA